MNGGDRAGLAVARYLRPEEKVVPFRARPELGELLRWCSAEGHVAARLVSGEGGTGKTRLALQLVQEMEANGWQPLWVRRGREKQTASMVREVGTPCVAIVDYAETRSGLAELLSDVAEDFDGPDLRVILLARGSGEWWQRLITSSHEVAGLLAAPPVVLGAISVEGGPNELFGEALTAFADKLGVERPGVSWRLTNSEPVVLVVHAAALLAVLDHSLGGGRAQPRSTVDVLTALLAHEGRYWAQSAMARGLDLDVTVQRLAVTAGCLIGADSETAAAGLMSRIPDLADSAERRGKVARWLHDLYPDDRPGETGAGDWIGSLRPDRVAEHLVVTELTARRELIPELFVGLSEQRATRALTVLARAAHTQSAALDLLRDALSADLKRLAVPALSVTIETNAVLGELLNDAVEAAVLPAAVLAMIFDAIPDRTVVLARLAVMVGRNLVKLLPAAEEPAARAYRLDQLSVRLFALGRLTEARPMAEEALSLLKELAAHDPDRYRGSLAGSLNNLSSIISEMGFPGEALPFTKKAAATYRELVVASADQWCVEVIDGQETVVAHGEVVGYLVGLANSLTNLGTRYADLGRNDEAISATEEAIKIRRVLSRAPGSKFRSDLARSLTNLSSKLHYLQRYDDGLPVTEEAVAIYRELAVAHPDRYRGDLAWSLDNLGNYYAFLNRPSDALAATEEAVAIRRELAAVSPGAYRPDLAWSLANLGHRYSKLGRPADALPAELEGVAIRREIAEFAPQKARPLLAASLLALGVTYSELDHPAEALSVTEEGVAVLHELAEANPHRYRPSLVDALTQLAAIYEKLGRSTDAESLAKEAAQIADWPAKR